MKKKILSVLIFIVFFGGIAGAIAFKGTDLRISVIFAGGIFFFVGLLGFFAQKMSLRTAPILMLCVIGAIMAGIPSWLVLAEKYPDSVPQPTDNLMIVIIGLVSIVIGVCIAVFPTLAELYNRRVCTESVMAKCVEVKSHHVSDKHGTRRVYSPVWEFEFYGRTYTVDENNYSDSAPEVGDIQEIFINPLNPEEVYRRVNGTIISVIIIGSVFVAFGILICCLA